MGGVWGVSSCLHCTCLVVQAMWCCARVCAPESVPCLLFTKKGCQIWKALCTMLCTTCKYAHIQSHEGMHMHRQKKGLMCVRCRYKLASRVSQRWTGHNAQVCKCSCRHTNSNQSSLDGTATSLEVLGAFVTRTELPISCDHRCTKHPSSSGAVQHNT